MAYRVTKSNTKKQSSLSRSSSSTFSNVPRRKPVQQSISKGKKDEDDGDDYFVDRLEDLGLITTLATDLSLRDVPQAMNHIRQHMFDEVPEKSGMNGARIAEVLNFRENLPPIVTNAHVHALIKSPTLVEKEIGQIAAAGLLRRVTIPGRGIGASSISDGLVLMKDWIAKVNASSNLTPELKEKYITYLKSTPSTSQKQPTLTQSESTTLLHAGLLTHTSTQFSTSHPIFSASSSTSSNSHHGTLTSLASIARAPSGSLAAVGGTATPKSSTSQLSDPNSTAIASLKPSLPNTGLFLKLVEAARAHLLWLLSKTKYGEMPMYLLKEKWDATGGVGRIGGEGRARWKVVLPVKTKKWKELWGVRFEWVLEECLGGGLVEVFETGSVGLGVRAV